MSAYAHARSFETETHGGALAPDELLDRVRDEVARGESGPVIADGLRRELGGHEASQFDHLVGQLLALAADRQRDAVEGHTRVKALMRQVTERVDIETAVFDALTRLPTPTT